MNTCAEGGGKVAAKTDAVIFGLLEALGIVFHKVARTIFFAGIVPEKRHPLFWNSNKGFLPAKKAEQIFYWQKKGKNARKIFTGSRVVL